MKRLEFFVFCTRPEFWHIASVMLLYRYIEEVLKLKLTQAITSRLFSVVRVMLNCTIDPTLIPKQEK